jgi:uncharacterized protein
MAKTILFIQGAGEGAYKEDKELVKSLRQELGSEYDVRYPLMPDENDAPYERLKQKIQEELAHVQEPVDLVGHSIGASVIAKYLSEVKLDKVIGGIFLIATPFWGGEGWLYEGYEELELPKDFAAKLPSGTQVFLYHSRDDGVVPFDHLALYAKALPQAKIRSIDKGEHQLNNDLSIVAQDIKGS